MSEARLATSVLAGALMRKAQGEGGFAAVLAKGDADAGAMLVILVDHGGNSRLLERILGSSGDYRWEEVAAGEGGNSESVDRFLSKRRRFDPDLWLIELTVASTQRFAAEMNETV
jgi:hypothetical protein